VVNITALSSYLLEDLYEHFKFDPLNPGDQSPGEQSPGDLTGQQFSRDGDVCGSRARSAPYQGARTGDSILLRSSYSEEVHAGGVVEDAFLIVRRALTSSLLRSGSADHNVEGSYETSWGEFGCLKAGPSVAAAQSLVRSLPKKFRDEITASAEEAAYQKFIRINNGCAEWSLNLQFSWEEELFGLLKQELDDFFHPSGELLDLDDLAVFNRGRCGPGASLGGERGRLLYEVVLVQFDCYVARRVLFVRGVVCSRSQLA